MSEPCGCVLNCPLHRATDMMHTVLRHLVEVCDQAAGTRAGVPQSTIHILAADARTTLRDIYEAPPPEERTE